MSRSTRNAAVALWTIGVACVLLLVIEGVTRAALRWRDGSWPQVAATAQYAAAEAVSKLCRLHPYLGTSPREGARIQHAGHSGSFNALGYRSPERSLEASPGNLRVLCSGGSTTFDLGAASDQESWPWMMEGRLRSAGLNAEVWNAGFPGWTSLENTISLLIRDQDLSPDVVILFQAINDLQPAAHRPFDPQYVLGHTAKQRSALGLDLKAPHFWQRSVLVGLFTRTPPPGGSRGDIRSDIDQDASNVFRRNVASFIAIAQRSGADVVLATQPLKAAASYDEDDVAHLEGWLGLAAKSVHAHLETFNDVLRAEAANDGVILADVAKDLDFVAEDFFDPMHYSPAGSKKLAAYFATATASALRARNSALPAESAMATLGPR